MPQRALNSYLYEGAVIVVSILIAFALDAGWDEYQESRVERRVLAELRDEMFTAQSNIEFSIAELEPVIAATTEFLELMGPDAEPPSQEYVEGLIDQAFNMNTLEVPSSVLDSLVASGQMRLIGDEQLRRSIANWPALVADVRENHEWHRVEADEVMNPYLAPYVSSRLEGNWTELMGLSQSRFERDAAPLLRDKEFESVYVWRLGRLNATLRESYVLLDATSGLIELINAEIGE